MVLVGKVPESTSGSSQNKNVTTNGDTAYNCITCKRTKNFILHSDHEISLNNTFIIQGPRIGKDWKGRCVRILNIVLSFLFCLLIVIGFSMIATILGQSTAYLGIALMIVGVLAAIVAAANIGLRLSIKSQATTI